MGKIKRFVFKIIFFTSLAALCLIAQEAFSQSSSERTRLENNKKKLEQEIANTQKLLDQTKANKNTSLNQIQLLKTQIRQREQLITAINSQIVSLNENINRNEEELMRLHVKMERLKKDYSQLVYMAFKNRKMLNKILFYLSAEDFLKMNRRIKYFSTFSDKVSRQIFLIEETQREITLTNENLKTEKANKARLAYSKENEKKQLNQNQEKKNKDLAALKKKEENLVKNLKAQQNRKKEIDIAIDKAIKEEMKRLAAKSKPAATTAAKATTTAKAITLTPEDQKLSAGFASNAAKLPWPVEKGVKIGEYGIYRHPDVPEVEIINKGIDILTVNGAQARAVFEGEVIGIIEVLGIKTVLIRHGEYFSVYKNLASVSVKKGDKVATKQNLGQINKSLNGEGAELHFEVWKNDINLNPNSWLTPR